MEKNRTNWLFWDECGNIQDIIMQNFSYIDGFTIYLSNSCQFNLEIEKALIEKEENPFIQGWMFLYYGKN